MNNEQRSQHAEEDALELISWYMEQPRFMTMLTDREIAAKLEWTQTRRVRQAYAVENAKQPSDLRLADFTRVRRARRWVDNNTSPFFVSYSFGTRRNGRGGTVTSLNSPEFDALDDPTDTATQHAVGQIGRLIQSARQHNAELARIATKLASYEVTFAAGAELERAVAIALASSDIRRRSEDLFPAETLERLVLAELYPRAP